MFTVSPQWDGWKCFNSLFQYYPGTLHTLETKDYVSDGSQIVVGKFSRHYV